MTKKKNNKSAIRTDKDKEVARLNRAIYSATNPVSGYPKGIGLLSVPLRAGAALFNPDEMQYEVTDPVADAAWRKRLGLSYDDKLLIENQDGSYRLPKNVEMEIPTDTTFIKNRIAANKKLAKQSNIMGEDWKLVDSMIDLDNKTLDALRKTYKTGEPVVINEYSNNSRRLAKNGELVEGAHDYKTPLNVLQNYTIQYDPKSNSMKYRDTYDFNGFETFVPGEPFEISGSVPLRKYYNGGLKVDMPDFSNVKFKSNLSTRTPLNFGQSLKVGATNAWNNIKTGQVNGIVNTAATAIGGLLAGGNESGVGNALQGIGSLASNIPGVGGLIGAGVNLLGGITNAAFGSNLNKEEIAKVEGQIGNLNSFTSNASDYDSLASNYINMPSIGYFSKDDIGSDGWFSDKAKDKWEELRKEKELAEQWVQSSLFNNAQNIATNKQQLLEANYSAYGGPIDMKYTGVMSPFGNQFKDGGIYIKPSKRGTFTAAAKKRGMGVQEFASKVLANKEDYSSAMVKKANFARNASKWHDDGGPLDTRMNNKYSLGGDFSNGVIQINSGGLHSTNPYEGVQIGVDPQGIPNLVEEGEVIYNDYVYSNRLRVPKEVRQKYKLRGVTFADAAKQLQKESEERPNDPISKKGLEASMQMLMNEQEMIRSKKEGNKYAEGGDIVIGEEEKVKPMKTSWLRYAPIVGSGISVLNDWFGGNEPNYSNADMFARAIEGTNRPIRARQIGNYLTYKPFDTNYYINKLDADTAAGRRAIVNTSGGNRAAAMAGILASDYNYGNQLGALARQAEEYNLAHKQAVEQFNRGTNVTNAEMAMKADLANAEQAMQRARMYGSLAEYRDSILARNRAEKSANLTNFIQGLGDLGTELTDKDKLRWLADLGVLKYDAKGNYTGNKSNESANGGKITRKKRGGFTI